MLDHQEALISVMVLISAADEHMSDRELNRMSRLVTELPVFTDFDVAKLPETAQKCAAILAKEEGVELLMAEVVAALPPRLRETAYAKPLMLLPAMWRRQMGGLSSRKWKSWRSFATTFRSTG